MYRALTWLARERGVDPEDEAGARGSSRARTRSSWSCTGTVTIGGHDVTTPIRSAEIDRLVPVVARHPSRARGDARRQRELADAGDAVIEGRDIGTVVAQGRRGEGLPRRRRRPCGRGRRQAERPGIGADALVTDLRVRDASDAERTLVARMRT